MAFVASVSLARAPVASLSATSFRGASVAAPARGRVANVSMNLDTIQQKIKDEMAKAVSATEKHGKSSKQAALAWDIVEELEAEASHMKASKATADPLDEYCKDSPEADECRVYDD